MKLSITRMTTRATAVGSVSSTTRCPFHKHFTSETYNHSKISYRILKTLNGSMYTMDSTTYYARTISYMCKMLMKLTTGVNVI